MGLLYAKHLPCCENTGSQLNSWMFTEDRKAQTLKYGLVGIYVQPECHAERLPSDHRSTSNRS